jgi:hypothetical protein
MKTLIYQDESGDLGWTFDKPNRKGGSSRYLTIAFVTVPEAKKQQLWRVVKKVYQKYKLNPKIEKKGSSYTDEHAAYIAGRIVDLVNRHDDIKICAITIKKENVQEHIRTDENIIYNYALVLKVAPVIKDLPHVTIIPDKRTIKVRSGNSCAEYLRTKLWFEMNSITQVDYVPTESTDQPHLWFIDMIANFVWRNYEDGRNEAYDRLATVLDETRLFF